VFSDTVSRSHLIKFQSADIELKPLFVLAEAEGNVGAGKGTYEVLNGVLVRHWCDKVTPQGMGITQIVAPTQVRQQLLKVSHDIPASGHLGTQKTTDRLLRHFWWPRINSSVREYCRSCDVCQRLGKGTIRIKAP